MANSAGQSSALSAPATLDTRPGRPAHAASQHAPTNSNFEPTMVKLVDPPTKPLALGPISSNTGTASGTSSAPQDAASKPVFKMKRTGHATLPRVSPTRDRALFNMPTPVTSHGIDAEPEAVLVVSDILPPPTPLNPAPESQSPAHAHPKASSASDSTRKTKYATDEERRRATSLALKQRWASGLMDHVHKKSAETLRRKKEAGTLLGTPGVAKSSGPPGSLKHTHMSSSSSAHFPRLPGLTAPATHHARKRPLVSEQLARLVEDKPASPGPPTQVARPAPTTSEKRDAATSRQSSINSDVEMLETKPHVSRSKPASEAMLEHGGDGDADSEGEGKDWSSTSSVGRAAEQPDDEDEDGNSSGRGDNHRPRGDGQVPVVNQPAVAPSFPVSALGDKTSDSGDGGDMKAEGADRTRNLTAPSGQELVQKPELDDAMEYSMDDSAVGTPVGTPLTPDSLQNAISEAEPGRPYTLWPDENGQLASLSGALLPAGYQLDTTIPGRPWACPVRTCRKAHCKKSDLGFHFQRVHYAACLNDNCDGTFSIKGVYQSKHTTSSLRRTKILIEAPPIVVSKEPLKSTSPIPKAQLPQYLATKSSLAGLQEPRTTRKRTRGGDGTAALWAYIQQHLVSTTDMPRTTEDENYPREAVVQGPSTQPDQPLESPALSSRQDVPSIPQYPGVPPIRRNSTPALSSRQPAPSALISQGTFQGPNDILEMEDWEIAPGRIRETAAASSSETIAFSKPYLSTAQAVPVCDNDVAFRVDTVLSGNVLQLESDPHKTRLCSVAVGKVRVKIGDEAEFVVGPHGMFKVKAGVACSVRNGLYLDAVLHTVVLVN